MKHTLNWLVRTVCDIRSEHRAQLFCFGGEEGQQFLDGRV